MEASTSFSIRATIVVLCEVYLGKLRRILFYKHQNIINQSFLITTSNFDGKFCNLRRRVRKLWDSIFKYQSRTNKTHEVFKDYLQFLDSNKPIASMIDTCILAKFIFLHVLDEKVWNATKVKVAIGWPAKRYFRSLEVWQGKNQRKFGRRSGFMDWWVITMTRLWIR